MESQPQNPELRINPENFHPCNNISGDFFTICAVHRILSCGM